MSKRSVIALAAVAAALAAFIFFYERHLLSTGDVSDRADRLLPTFVRDRVTRLEIEREGGNLVLAREQEDGAEEGELGEWMLVEPVRSETDFDAVDSVLGALEWADARRSIEGVSAEDRTTFGLAEPRLRAFYTVAGERVPLAFGGEDPQGSGVYAALEDETVAYVVGKDLFEALDHDAAWFRDKELLADAGPARASRLRLEGAAGTRVLDKRGHRWWLTEPQEGFASARTVNETLRALEGLRAERFVADEAGSLAQYGLDTPIHLAHFARERGDGAETVEATLRIGRACDENDPGGVRAEGAGGPRTKAQVYARVDEGPIVCVSAESVASLGKTAEELRDARLVTVGDEDVQRIEIVSGNRRLELYREDGEWKLRSRQGPREIATTADPQAVADFLREARAVTARSFLRADDAAVRERGLGSPVATLTLVMPGEGSAEEITEVVRVGRGSGGTWARRGEEPSILEVDEATLALLDTAPTRFRARRVIDEDGAHLARLVIRRRTEREVVERTEDGFRVAEPIAVAADDAVMRAIARGIGELSAESFVAEQAAPEHGLAQPRFVVEARFEEPASEDDAHDHGEEDDDPEPARDPVRNYLVRIGAETENGAYARLDDDPAVFVVDRALVEAIEPPVVDRGLLATDERNVARIEIRRGGQTITIAKEGGAWQANGAPADRDRVSALLRSLETLRATHATSYGPPDATSGLARPRGTVTVHRTEEAEGPRDYTIALGAAAPPSVHARRADLDVGFLIGADAAAPFLEY
jgi:hypothetical protein